MLNILRSEKMEKKTDRKLLNRNYFCPNSSLKTKRTKLYLLRCELTNTKQKMAIALKSICQNKN